MKQKLSFEEITGILFFLAGAVMLALSVCSCFGSDIWYDELFTMGLANQSCGDLISMTARDVHPPLYYLIVKLFLMGTSEGDYALQVVIAKLVSCLPFALCMLFSMKKIKKLFGLLSAGLFCFLLISMPEMADYTVEIRMYGFTVLFLLMAAVYAFELLKEGTVRNWSMLTICAIMASLTHYFACVAACLVYLYLFFALCRQHKRKAYIKPYLCSAGICIICVLPWLLLAGLRQLGQVQESYWIQPVSLRTLGGCVKYLFQPAFGTGAVKTGLTVLFFALYVFTMWFVRKKEEKESFSFALGCIGVLAGLVAVGMAVSLLLRPIFVYRYMLPAMGLFWLAYAVLLGMLGKQKKLLLPLLLFTALVGILNFRAFYGEEKWKKLQMDAALESLAMIGSEDVLIYNFDQAQGVVSYYLPNETYLWYGTTEELIQEMFPQNHTLVEGTFTDEAGIARIRSFLDEGKKVWFLGSGTAREEIIEKWEKEGILAQELTSIMIERYWLNVYLVVSK